MADNADTTRTKTSEPVVIMGAVVAGLPAILGALITLGALHLDETQAGALVLLVSIIVGLVTTVITRGQVTPVADLPPTPAAAVAVTAAGRHAAVVAAMDAAAPAITTPQGVGDDDGVIQFPTDPAALNSGSGDLSGGGEEAAPGPAATAEAQPAAETTLPASSGSTDPVGAQPLTLAERVTALEQAVHPTP